MSRSLVIAGCGFAGMWAALTAARTASVSGRSGALDITVVAPRPVLVIRPRLYESALDGLEPDVAPLLAELGVRFLAGRVETVDPAAHVVNASTASGSGECLHYDRLVLATGSELHRPAVPGLAEHAFDVDQIESARRLDAHLDQLRARPATAARNTVVVAGGGFTGIELAAELPARLRQRFGARSTIRVVLIEQAPAVGPDLGPGPRPVILQALGDCGVEVVTGRSVGGIDADGVILSDGSRIPAATVVWTAGARASALAARLGGSRDAFGRVDADPYLRARGIPDVFVAGDVAHAATDDAGNVASMSCQHALGLGRVAGHNAAAELLGLSLHAYSQPKYVTCLDLGPWGAVYTEGWERRVLMAGADAKALKRDINTKWIYPPADRAAALEVARPDFVIVP